ncbi:MAG: hypothetical protein KBT46_03085 [Ruminococcus sp.]|nr:hypothetical protein [Candidatus Copronaster equi]
MEKANEKMYIVRCKNAGVFFGEVVKSDAESVEMKNVRKLWYWDGACAVEQLAMDGVANPDDCKFTVVVPSMILESACQIIQCTDKAIESLKGVKVWRR